MREGSNPQKTEKKIELSCHHRVIIVVFIPELSGYYENSLEVFKLCLNSLIAANSRSYAITVVNNGSCKEVSEFLNDNLENEDIDTLISHNQNIGKIDALLGAARGAREELITISDADILFIQNWNFATREVFVAFKKAGSVSPIPFRHGIFYGTSSVFKEILLGRSKFNYKAIPENFIDQNRYLTSINWNNEKNNEVKWPVVEKNGVQAIIGSGHQVLTIKRDILFSTVPKPPSLTLVGGDSEYKYVDEPIDKAGLMRLSTKNNYAFHIGNKVENWMREELSVKKHWKNKLSESEHKQGTYKTINHRTYIIRKHLIKRLFKIFYPE